jgi:diguanylate cyclase
MTDEPLGLGRRRGRRLAPIDHLTGLGSQQALAEQGPMLLIDDEAACRHTALLMLDIDEFKAVNDTLGHAGGDAVLAAVAERLRECLRDTDLVCRVGGDEFAVLATGLADADDATAVARKILAALAPEIAFDDVRLHVDVSVGIALRGVDGDTLEDLRRAADRAMYAAKAAGSGQYRRSAATRAAQGPRITPAQLAAAVRDGALVLNHHPQLDSATGEVVATEALLRWNHPDLGPLHVRDLLPLAEQAGLLGLIDRTAVTLAVADLARFHVVSPALRVAVDVSPRALLGRTMVEHLARCLAQGRAPAELLTLEIAEPASQYARSTALVLTEIEQLGCRVSLHEFGVARTSLGVLARFTGIREVKLAPGLVSLLAEQEAAQRTVRAIVAAAHALDLLVVAEGITTAEDAARVRALGCDVLQGDHLSPGLTADQTLSLLTGSGTAVG